MNNGDFAKLADTLSKYEKIAVAFSGGSDSLFLLYSAITVLGKENVLALTARGDFFSAYEELQALNFIHQYDVEHVFVDVSLEENKRFVKNDAKRCYFCKNNIMKRFLQIASERGFFVLAEGTNKDDLDDIREGFAAVVENGVKSPLLEAGITKNDIASFLKDHNMMQWYRPSQACLASRIPYGVEITKDILEKIEKGEDFLRQTGVTQVRLRHHGDIARIEILPQEFSLVTEDQNRKKVVDFIKKLGYKYVTLELAGFSSGSLNK